MKICIGTIILNEEACLRELWPSFVGKFDGIIALDNGSIDGSRKVLEGFGAHIIDNPQWDYHFSNARNMVIKKAEELGYDAIMTLDADEALFPKDVDFIRELQTRTPFFSLPRFALWKDYEHWWPAFFPDYHARNFRLNRGVVYSGNIHEQPNCPKPIIQVPRQFKAFIYHYGHVKDNRDKLLMYHNTHLAQKGKPLIKKPLPQWENNLQPGKPLKIKHPMSGKDPSPIQKQFYV